MFRFAAAGWLTLSIISLPLPALAADFDLLIRNARIVDGAGTPAFAGDIAVRGDTIVRVERSIDASADVIVDAEGLVLTPGFIDLHVHARGNILENPSAANYVLQGVTTIFEGPDGGSALPVGAFLEQVEKARPSLNFATFVGQGSIRGAVIGAEDRPAVDGELARMRNLVREAMLDGAFGLSTGLRYVPGAFTPTGEVVDLARIAGTMGGIHISHMRDEANDVDKSVRETIRIGEEGNLPTQITHAKAMGKRNWGRSAEILSLVRHARQRGVDVTLDVYPYTASSTGISALLPRWALEGSAEERQARLDDPDTRALIRAAIVESLREDRGGGNLANVQIAAARWEPTLAGKTLLQITREWKESESFEDAADVVLEMMAKGGASAIYHAMAEEDVERLLASPWSMIASDGELAVFGRNSPHPRGYGTFPRVLSRYVREREILTLEEAVRKMTSMPAARVGIMDRGLLRPGMKADLVLFDPARIADRATFTEPHQYPVGIALVVVNGRVVARNGELTGSRPGVILRGPAWRGWSAPR